MLALCLMGLSAPATPAARRSIQVDPSFAYYRDRSPESIARELRVNGYHEVRLVCTSTSSINSPLLQALVRAGMQVWMLTFANGTYSTADLPAGWEAWQMKLRTSQQVAGYRYLCPNNLQYRAWKKRAITEALRAHRAFVGVDLAESFFPAYQGPESPLYGCLCPACAQAFRKRCPQYDSPPEFNDVSSPRYWRNDTARYRQWVGFRVESVVAFLDDLVNGPGGIRERCPWAKVATWSLGLDVPEAVARVREWEALDGPAIVRRVRPDMHVIQTDWPDWTKADLPGDYPLRYREFVQAIRAAAPHLPLLLQADIGSQPQMRRSRAWQAQVEAAARKIGCLGATHYEYHLGDYLYSEPPMLVSARRQSKGTVVLTFTKRLAQSAAEPDRYALSAGSLQAARVDGNLVFLTVWGAPRRLQVTVRAVADDPQRRFLRDRPPTVMPRPVTVRVR